eukprot:jgi/Botrbrau1/20448/Bobra.145_2s0012.1
MAPAAGQHCEGQLVTLQGLLSPISASHHRKEDRYNRCTAGLHNSLDLPSKRHVSRSIELVHATQVCERIFARGRQVTCPRRPLSWWGKPKLSVRTMRFEPGLDDVRRPSRRDTPGMRSSLMTCVSLKWLIRSSSRGPNHTVLNESLVYSLGQWCPWTCHWISPRIDPLNF